MMELLPLKHSIQSELVWLLLITNCVHCTLTNVTAGCFICFCQSVRITLQVDQLPAPVAFFPNLDYL